MYMYIPHLSSPEQWLLPQTVIHCHPPQFLPHPQCHCTGLLLESPLIDVAKENLDSGPMNTCTHAVKPFMFTHNCICTNVLAVHLLATHCRLTTNDIMLPHKDYSALGQQNSHHAWLYNVYTTCTCTCMCLVQMLCVHCTCIYLNNCGCSVPFSLLCSLPGKPSSNHWLN